MHRHMRINLQQPWKKNLALWPYLIHDSRETHLSVSRTLVDQRRAQMNARN